MQIDSISWFPGHMTKTRRMISSELANMDAVCEIVDARIPYSSRNPDFDDMIQQKPRMLILNRIDQADPKGTKLWKDYFENKGIIVLETDAKSGKGINSFEDSMRKLLKDKISSYEAKGQVGRTLRIMVIGVPNVGKSTIINRLAGRKAAKTEDRPGVTRTKQWVPIGNHMELLDTPGILWPKFDDPLVGIHLAITGAIKDDVLDIEDLACRFLTFLQKKYPEAIEKRYGFHPSGEEGYELLEKCGRKRGYLVSGGEIDTLRMANNLFDEYRAGKLGFFTIEYPEEIIS